MSLPPRVNQVPSDTLFLPSSDVDGGAPSVTTFTVAGDVTVYAAGSTATLACGSVGTLRINAERRFTLSPALNCSGAVPVATYTDSDGNRSVGTSTLTIALT